MKAAEILIITKPLQLLKGHVASSLFRRFLALCAGVVMALSMSANAQGTVYSVNIVGCIPERTAYLISADLTPAERQAYHAQTFNLLPPLARSVYLRVVAYAVGITLSSDGEPPSATVLAEYLDNLSSFWNGTDWSWITPPVRQALLDHKSQVKSVMQLLNVLIAPQVADNPSFQTAMDAGAVDSFFDIWPEL